MIGDLLQRLDLHGDVKPVDDMRRRLRQRLRQNIHDLGAIGKNRHLAALRIALALQGPQRPGLKLALRCVGGGEIAAGARAAPAAAAWGGRRDEIMALFGKQTAAMEALADLVAKVRNDDVERRNEHATAIAQLWQGQMKIAQFTDGLATQYAHLFKALSNCLDAVEKEAFGPNYNQQPSTPPLN